MSKTKKNSISSNKRGLLHPTLPTKPNHIRSTDFAGLFPATKRGNKHIQIITDTFSNRVSFVASTDVKSTTQLSNILDDMFTFGVSDKILSDQAKGFTAMLPELAFEELDIHKIHSSPLHPQGNGLAERTDNEKYCRQKSN